jgi:hypothetical protein
MRELFGQPETADYVRRFGYILSASGTIIIPAGQIAFLTTAAAQGNSVAMTAVQLLLAWNARYIGKVPACFDCTRAMGPIDICLYVIVLVHNQGDDHPLVTPICCDCANRYKGDPHIVDAAVFGALQRQRADLSLEEAGIASAPSVQLPSVNQVKVAKDACELKARQAEAELWRGRHLSWIVVTILFMVGIFVGGHIVVGDVLPRLAGSSGKRNA